MSSRTYAILGGPKTPAGNTAPAVRGARLPSAAGSGWRCRAQGPAGGVGALLRRADTAMYAAKASGKGTIRWHEPASA
ncbi:hypothetical protein [Actinoplanes siamensis]|uniref:GGDEF domain-containing protein n=1 Tax=Actinoplanes siamensis TaxID=1223317 RepID=A0A919NBR1_9ACTN|nr:hypothetical protein [Actinoplanes siamensis]GIF07951.1 hypothetical protein Asi03nite_54890 [Actinoplanes siamensis]